MIVTIDGVEYTPKSSVMEAAKGVRYIMACEVSDAQRAQALSSELWSKGDMRLVWVNEGDMYAHLWNPSA